MNNTQQKTPYSVFASMSLTNRKVEETLSKCLSNLGRFKFLLLLTHLLQDPCYLLCCSLELHPSFPSGHFRLFNLFVLHASEKL